ncbi:hypothetical protein Tco_0672741 [Tanacetum coccineum]
MANQEQIPPQQEQPFVAAKQVSFNLEDIILNTNNEVALLYPEHNNQEYFKCVSDFISKCCLRKPFTRSPDMYKVYLAEFWYSTTALENSKVSFSIPTGGIFREVGINTFRNAIGAHYLAHSSEYVTPPSIDIVRQWFPMIGYGEEVSVKGTLRKNLLPLRWRLLMAQIIQCLGGKTGGFDQITNKDAIILYILANGINIDYANIFWVDIILKLKKKQREKALKPNQSEEPPFIAHMLAICNANETVAFKAPKPSFIAERVPQGTKARAQPGHKKQSSSKQTFVSSKEATKGGSSKAPTGFKTGHSKKRKESSSAMDSNLSQPPISILVDPGMQKKDHQATGGLTSLGVTRNDALAVSTAEADLGNSAPSTDPHVLADQTKSVSEGLDTVLTQPLTGKGASSIAKKVEEEEASSTIKLEDLAKLVSNVQPCFKDLDSPKYDPVIIIEESDEENDEIHATENVETKDSSVPKSSSPKSSLIQELTNQVLILQSQKNKLELKKNKVEAEAALLKAQPLFPNVEQLNELLVKSLKTEFSNILTAHDLSSSLPTELKDISSKLNELTGKEFISLPAQVASVQAKLKTLVTLSGLFSNVTKALNKFAQVLDSASSKAGYQSVPSAGQANTMPAEGEKNRNQAIISQLFRRRAEKVNLNRQQPKTATSLPTPPVITTTTTQIQSPSFQLTKSSSQPEGEHIKKDKGKNALSSEEAEKESTKSGSNDETTHMPGSTVESYKKKELKKFDFVTESREHVHLTKEQISAQKKIEEEAKAEAARREGEIRKEELIDLLGLDVVNKHYNDKL